MPPKIFLTHVGETPPQSPQNWSISTWISLRVKNNLLAVLAFALRCNCELNVFGCKTRGLDELAKLGDAVVVLCGAMLVRLWGWKEGGRYSGWSRLREGREYGEGPDEEEGVKLHVKHVEEVVLGEEGMRRVVFITPEN